jgi:acetyl-CoA synthetase
MVRKQIGPIATPDKIIFVTDLPKTRSGKIMRRLLRKIAANESLENEDLSTLANAESLAGLVTTKKKKSLNTSHL